MNKRSAAGMNIKSVLILFILMSTLCSCRSRQKFNKAEWGEMADLMMFPNRKYMIDDLVDNYQLKGLTYQEIVELLGPPQSKLDSNLETYYDIDIDYGWDIDPVYTKMLDIKFDQDTIVKEFEVKEWEK